MTRKEKFEEELALYKSALASKNAEQVKFHLGRAHILSQNSVPLHLKVHLLMLIFGLQRLELREILGQTLRLLVTVPGHLMGKVPQGNIGWSTVGLTETMEIPSDLKAYIIDLNL